MAATLPLVVARTGKVAAGIFQSVDTERLRLRAPTADDLAAYHRLHADPLAHPHDLAARHPDLAHSLGRIAEMTEDWDLDGLGYWSVFSGSGGEYLGVAGVRRSEYSRSAVQSSWNVYYRLDPTCWGHGYAAEAINAAVGCLLSVDPDATLRAAIRPGNLASVRVAEMVGMTLSHQQPDLTGAPELIYERPVSLQRPSARTRLRFRRAAS